MEVVSFLKEDNFSEKGVSIDVMIDNDFTKEIRLSFLKNQIMKKHKTKYPITLMCLQGQIKFSVKEEVFILNSGDMIALEGNITHELEAIDKSVAKLSLSKNDNMQRLETRLIRRKK